MNKEKGQKMQKGGRGGFSYQGEKNLGNIGVVQNILSCGKWV